MADVSKVLPSFDLFRGANKNSGSQVPLLIGILLSDDNLVQSNVGNCSPLCSSVSGFVLHLSTCFLGGGWLCFLRPGTPSIGLLPYLACLRVGKNIIKG